MVLLPGHGTLGAVLYMLFVRLPLYRVVPLPIHLSPPPPHKAWQSICTRCSLRTCLSLLALCVVTVLYVSSDVCKDFFARLRIRDPDPRIRTFE
jgi:hypothetical protein